MSTAQVFLLGFAAVLAAASVGVSLFAVWRAQVLATLADERARTALAGCRETLDGMQKRFEDLSAELHELQTRTSDGTFRSVPKTGLNLSKRSQALRMHRQGDSPDRIAAALEIPLQEVDLLLKVHRIVIGRL